MSYIIYPSKDRVKLPERGYFKKGDKGINITLISSFMAANFMGYDYKTGAKIEDILGDIYGSNLEKWILLFQKNNRLETDGNIGPKTLDALASYGLEIER